MSDSIIHLHEACDYPHCMCSNPKHCMALEDINKKCPLKNANHLVKSESMTVRVKSDMLNEFKRRAKLENKNLSLYMRPLLENLLLTITTNEKNNEKIANQKECEKNHQEKEPKGSARLWDFSI